MEKFALDSSLFVSDEIHQKEVTLPDGKQHKLHFREMSASTFRRFLRMERSESEVEREQAVPWLISACLVTPDGDFAVTLEQAGRLKAGPMGAIFSTIMDMNGVPLEGRKGKH